MRISRRFLILYGSVLVFTLASVRLFYAFTVLPLRERERQFMEKQSELQERLESSRKKVSAIKDSEQKLGRARSRLNRFVGDLGDASPMVALPAQIAEYLSNFGIAAPIVRLATAQPEKGLAAYQRIYWSVGLPIPKTDHNLVGILLAVAQLEEQERWLQVNDFALLPDEEQPTLRNVTVSLVTFAPK